MRTQTKCTLSLCGLFIIEILPIPFTAIYAVYAVRKRSAWIPGTVTRLYADKPVDPDKPVKEVSVLGHNPMKTRRNCTIMLTLMLLLDIVLPFTILFGLYIVRRRPYWFNNVSRRLYADQFQDSVAKQDEPVAEVIPPAPILGNKFLNFRIKSIKQGA